MKYFKKIIGDKVYLSPLRIEDSEIYVKWLNDENVAKYTHQLPKNHTIESERDWIENSNKNGEYVFGIIKQENDELIGNCGINKINYNDRTATLGIFIGEDKERNNGYGTETINLLLGYCFDILNFHNVDLDVLSFNERAIACYKKAGFVECGRRHEAYFYNGTYHDIISMEILEKDYRIRNNQNW